MTTNFKKILKSTVLILFFVFIILYAFFRGRALIFGTDIKNVNITDGATITESVLDITGVAKNASKITLNGREIVIDKDGNFYESIALISGYNIVSIYAEDKFGHKDEENYQLRYSPIVMPQIEEIE